MYRNLDQGRPVYTEISAQKQCKDNTKYHLGRKHRWARLLMFHKPKGVVVAARDKEHRTVFDILPTWVKAQGWNPVGRLDKDTRGLLLLTRPWDGSLADRLNRPSSHILKTYQLWVQGGRVEPAHKQAMLSGLTCPRVGLLTAASVYLPGDPLPSDFPVPNLTRGDTIEGSPARLSRRFYLQLDQGKNRHIRRMILLLAADSTGQRIKLRDLCRVAYGPIYLDIPSGHMRLLRSDEVSTLLKSANPQ
eukprot:g81571.t1